MTVKSEQAAAVDEGKGAAKADPKPTTTDVVKQVREKQRAAAESAQPGKNEKAAAPAKTDDVTDEKAGDDNDEKKDSKPGESAEFYSDDELAKLPSLVNADMKRVRPELRNTVTAMQTAERKRLQKLDAAIIDAKAKPATEEKPKAAKKDRLFTDDELDDIFSSDEGRSRLNNYLKEQGVELDEVKELSEDRIMNKALNLAAQKYPELGKDPTFWKDTVQAIADDDDLTDDFNKNLRNPRVLGRIIKEAAADVRAIRAAADGEKTAKERERLEKDKESVKRNREAENAKPGSIAAKSGKKAGVNADGPMATRDVIKMIRSQRGYASS